jgi:hypothetical protein
MLTHRQRQTLRDGEFVGRRFATKTLAVRWTELERLAM